MVVIPNSVTKIGDSSFRWCESLTSITIPNTVVSIGDDAFANCRSLTSIDISNAITKIKNNVFLNCESLKSITIPNSVTSIGKSAFSGCSSLTSVTIPNSVTEMEDNPFGECEKLIEILVAEGNKYYTSIEGITYSKNQEILVAYPAGKKGAFTIPNAVIEIGGRAFSGCRGLSSVVIPYSVNKIGPNAFWGCISLNTIYALPVAPPVCLNRIFDNTPEDAVVYIPSGTFKQYFVASGWSHFTDFREMGVLDIKLSNSELELQIGETAALKSEIVKDNEVTVASEMWKTSNPEIATVEGGVVTAVGEGVATISYTMVDGYGCPHTERCQVTVTDNAGVETVTIDDSRPAIEYYNFNGIRVNARTISILHARVVKLRKCL